MASTISPEGQVTIPAPILERLGLRPGDSVDFEPTANGGVALIKTGSASLAVRLGSVLGCLNTGKSTDEMMEFLRGDD